jgi:hypothetical protein
LDKYKHRAKDILKFAINYNKRIAEEIIGDDCYVCNELGRLKNSKNDDYYNLVIFVDLNTKDSEIKDLVDKLPKFTKYL